MPYLRYCASALLIIAASQLCSCGGLLLLQKGDATVFIGKDGKYSITLDGTFIGYSAASDLAEKGSIDVKHEMAIKSQEGGIKTNPRFRYVRYLGQGRFQIIYKEEGTITPETKLFKDTEIPHVMNIACNKDGRVDMTVRNIPTYNSYIALFEVEQKKHPEEPLSEKDWSAIKLDYKKYFSNVDWHVKVRTDAKVIRHNAASTPWFFGLFGAYEWRVNKPGEPAPYISVQLNNKSGAKK